VAELIGRLGFICTQKIFSAGGYEIANNGTLEGCQLVLTEPVGQNRIQKGSPG